MAKKKNGKTSSGKKPANGKKSKADKPEAAYFLSLSLKNVRCFGEEEQTLDLSDGNGRPSQWTLLFGNNGTGKTTLLQALAGIAPLPGEDSQLSEEIHDAVSKFPFEGRFMNEMRFTLWLHAGRNRRKSVVSMARNDETETVCSATITSGGLSRGAKRSAEQFEMLLKTTFGGGSSGHWPADCKEFRVFGYGASRRIGTSTIAGVAAGTEVDSLFSDQAELLNAEEWILRADYSASKPSDIQREQKRRLGQAKELLIDILPEVEDIEITEPTSIEPNPSVRFKTPYGFVPLSQLGYGYQTLIAWIVDFACRLFEQYPDSENPLAEPAVCLVDEIDLHLHPKWQREIMSFLSERFPNTQFIATAHSPLIAQAADENTNIAVLRREGDHVVIDNDVKVVHGWRIDQVLTSDLFELPTARPAQLDKDIERRKKLLTKSRLTKKEKEELAELEERVGDLPAGDNSAQSRADMALIQETLQLLKQQQGQPS